MASWLDGLKYSFGGGNNAQIQSMQANAKPRIQQMGDNQSNDWLAQHGLLPGTVPEYQNGLNSPAYGNLIQGAQGINYDQSGVNALKDYALAPPGGSPWEKMMLDRQGVEQNQALSGAGGANNAATQNAYSQVAQRGGLNSGAQQRIAMSGQRDLNAQRQQIYGQGAQDRAQIGAQGEQNRLSALQSLPGAQAQSVQAQVGALSPWQTLLNANVQNAGSANQFNQGIFNTQLGAYGANKTANAIATSGGGGSGWLG